MTKNIYGRRIERINIDGKLHLVRTRWMNPADQVDKRCPFCRSSHLKPMMDIIQRGLSDDRCRTYFLCQDCDHCVEYRYNVECWQNQELNV